MKLSPNTITVLKNFYNINQSIRFTPGNVLKTMSSGQSIIGQAKLDIKIPESFGIYDLSRFLNAVGLFEDPELEIVDTFVKISDDRSTILYNTAGEKSIKVPEKALNLPAEVPCHFTLTHDDTQKLFKAIAILGMPEIAIIGDGKKLSVKGLDSEGKVEDSFSLNIGDTKNKYKAIFKIDNINKILPGDYDVRIASLSDSRGDSVNVSHFKSLTDKVEYWIAVSSNSEF